MLLFVLISSCKYEHYVTNSPKKIEGSDKLVKTTYQVETIKKPEINKPEFEVKCYKSEKYEYKNQRKIEYRRKKKRAGKMILYVGGSTLFTTVCFAVADWDLVTGSSVHLVGGEAAPFVLGAGGLVLMYYTIFKADYSSSEYKYKYKFEPAPHKYYTNRNIKLNNSSVVTKANNISYDCKTDNYGNISLKMSDFSIPNKLNTQQDFTFNFYNSNTEFDNKIIFPNTYWMSPYAKINQSTNLYFSKSLSKSKLILPVNVIGAIDGYSNNYTNNYLKLNGFGYSGFISTISSDVFYATNYKIPDNTVLINNQISKDFEIAKNKNTIDAYITFLSNYYGAEENFNAHILAYNIANNSNLLDDFYKYTEFYLKDTLRQKLNPLFDTILQQTCQLAFNELRNYETYTEYNNFHKKYPELNANLISKNSYRDGKLIWWYKNGNKDLEANYFNDKLHGTIYYFYKNGQLERKINYNKGVQNGEATTWHENGEIKLKANLVNDKIHGKLEEYNEIGNLIGTFFYNNGVIVSSTYFKYYKNGNLKSEKRYITDVDTVYILHGVTKTYYENGKPKIVCNFKDNELNGKLTMYYESGKKKYVADYKDGKLNGYFIAFHDNGAIQEKTKYINNEKQGKSILKNRYGKNYTTKDLLTQGTWKNKNGEYQVEYFSDNKYEARRKTFYLVAWAWRVEKGVWRLEGNMLIIMRTHIGNDILDTKLEKWYYEILSISQNKMTCKYKDKTYEYINDESFDNDVTPTELYKQIMNN